MPRQIAFCSCGQQDICAGFVDRGSRCSDALYCNFQIIKRLVLIASLIFDGEPSDTGLNAKPDIRGHSFRIMSVTGFEICVDGYAGIRGNLSDMRKYQVPWDSPVRIRQSVGKGEPRTRGGDGFEAQMTEIAGSPHIPRIWNRKATRLVQPPEFCPKGFKFSGPVHRDEANTQRNSSFRTNNPLMAYVPIEALHWTSQGRHLCFATSR
jgi:hypothetical protein